MLTALLFILLWAAMFCAAAKVGASMAADDKSGAVFGALAFVTAGAVMLVLVP